MGRGFGALKGLVSALPRGALTTRLLEYCAGTLGQVIWKGIDSILIVINTDVVVRK